MLLDVNTSQLLVMDYQDRLTSAMFEGDEAYQRAFLLAKLAQKLSVPVHATVHMPQKLGPLNAELQPLCTSVTQKTHFSACQQGLMEVLTPKTRGGNARSLPKHVREAQAEPERPHILIAGIEAHICVLQTALELMDDPAEWQVWVVVDACTSRNVRNRDAAFDRLASNGVELVTAEMVVTEWLEDTEHELFKWALGLIK